MEGRGDDEAADGQRVQPSNANACPSLSGDERANGTLSCSV